MKTQRIDALDFYKAAGALLVILIHVTATPVTTLDQGFSFWTVFFINRLAKPAVPMFIFASGLALYRGYEFKEFRYTGFLKKRLVKILAPYVLWSAFYYGYYIYQQVYTFSWKFFWNNTVSGRMMYHFYFVVAIVQFYLVFGILRGLVQRYSAKRLIPAAVLLNIASYAVLPSIWIHRAFITSLVYFLAGCYFAKDYEKAMEWLGKWKWKLGAIFAAAGILYCCMFYLELWHNDVYMENRWLLNYIYFPYCMTGLLLYYRWADKLCQRAGETVRRLAAAVNGGSYYIYLGHPFALVIAGQWAMEHGITGVLGIMAMQLGLVAVAVIPMCTIYSEVKKRMRN